MNAITRRSDPHPREAGFTLIEALVAIVVLIFGLMAVTNLLLVAASSNTVANQGTAATASATRTMDMLKNTAFQEPDPNWPPGGPPLFPARPILVDGGIAWAIEPGAPDCSAAAVTDYHCTESTPGVGSVHTHWWISTPEPALEPRLKYLRVRSEGTGSLARARSRAEFTGFSVCTAPPREMLTGGNCPGAPE